MVFLRSTFELIWVWGEHFAGNVCLLPRYKMQVQNPMAYKENDTVTVLAFPL